MNKKTIVISILMALLLMGALVLSGCGGSKPAETAAAPVSDGSEDLKIDFQLNTAGADSANYFNFSGNIRYMAAEDKLDEVSGASAAGATHLFNAYRYDIEGKQVFPGGLRSLFLFATNPWAQFQSDGVNAVKNSDGSISIQYSHRGTAYRITTDASGILSFPNGKFELRAIGYISGSNPQVISKDFSADGTAATIDWAKVWDSSVADGKKIDETSDKTTDKISTDLAAPNSMFYYDGKLKVSLNAEILKISGFLTAVSRK